jgi:segregation and condensation protein B
MDRTELKAVVEGIIYVSEDPVTVKAIVKGLKGVEKAEVEEALKELAEASRVEERGVEIRQVAGGYRMSTKAQHHDAIRHFVRTQRPPLRLTHQALVSLAVIAYRQPVTAPEIKAIRGVDPSGPIHTLLEKGLIEVAGRKEVVGRPILYRVTRDFLLRFGLKDLKELPTEKEFEELARSALAETGELFEEPAADTSDEAVPGAQEEERAEGPPAAEASEGQ